MTCKFTQMLFCIQDTLEDEMSAHVGRADEVIATDKEDLVSRVKEITGAW